MRQLPRSVPAAGRKGTSLSAIYALGHPDMGLALVFVIYRGNLRVARLCIERQHVFLRMQLNKLSAGHRVHTKHWPRRSHSPVRDDA